MMAETFKPGDIVRLKSGGPVMTVLHTDGRSASVGWFVGAELKFQGGQDPLPFDALEHAKTGKSAS